MSLVLLLLLLLLVLHMTVMNGSSLLHGAVANLFWCSCMLRAEPVQIYCRGGVCDTVCVVCVFAVPASDCVSQRFAESPPELSRLLCSPGLSIVAHVVARL